MRRPAATLRPPRRLSRVGVAAAGAIALLGALVPQPGRAQEAAATASSPPARPEAPTTGWTKRPFALENTGVAFRLALTGYVQADFRAYHEWTVAKPGLRAPVSGWHRLRFGVQGDYRRLSFEVDLAPVLDSGPLLKDTWAEWRFTRALRLRAGRFKVPVSPEWMGSPARTDFLERGVVSVSMAPDRDWGAELNGEAGRLVEYQAGLFRGDGEGNRIRAGTTLAGRILLKPTSGLEVGGSMSAGDVTANPSNIAGNSVPKGFSASSQTGYRFFAPVFVDGRRRRWDAETTVRRGPFGFRGELLEESEERLGQGLSLEDLPAVRGHGFQIVATWLVTGEQKARTIRPRRCVFQGPGALELGARFEQMSVDDVENRGPESLGHRARNLRPAGFRCVTGGVSWWPTEFLRLMGDVVGESYRDALLAPESGRKGTYVSFLGRVQVMLP
jgi:phosphate-selective porin